MARIKNYVVDGILSDNDKVIGTDVDSLNQTKNYKLSDIRSYVVSGLSPEIGGNFKISEVVYEGELETPEEVANELDPSYIVSAYENLFFNINGDLYLLNKTDINIGVLQTALTSADFIEFPTSVGPTGATGNGISSISLLSTVGLVKTYRIIYTNSAFFDFAVTDGTNGTNGTNYTANNLQRTVTASTTILETDNNSTIIINNGDTAVDITVPTGLSSKFAIGFIQQGTADVTFVPGVGVTINSPLDYLKIKGENYWAYLEKVGTSEVFQLAGEIKE